VFLSKLLRGLKSKRRLLTSLYICTVLSSGQHIHNWGHSHHPIYHPDCRSCSCIHTCL